jgi:hypothetical protein
MIGFVFHSLIILQTTVPSVLLMNVISAAVILFSFPYEIFFFLWLYNPLGPWPPHI